MPAMTCQNTAMNQNAPEQGLLAVPIFQSCTPDLLARISTGAVTERQPKGKILFINGDNAASYFLIRKGWVKLFRETLDGDQAVIDILPAGHLFGETAIFENGIYAYSAEVIEDAEILRLSLPALRHAIETDSHMALAMLKSMSHHRRDQEMEIEHRTLQSAPQRIGCFLLRLIDQRKKGPITINLPYDKTLLALRLGMQPETFSRALARLKDETGMRIKASTVEIDSVSTLADYACAACSSGFPCADK